MAKIPLKGTRIAKVLPSIVTLLALGCGVSAVKESAEGRFSNAVYLLFFAGIFDGLDGHVARLLSATTQFGAELDSLCDLVDFGVAPSLVVYFWARDKTKDTVVSDLHLWFSALFFCFSCSYRLARFNLTDITQFKPKEIAKEMEGAESSESENDDPKQKKPKKQRRITKLIQKSGVYDGYISAKKFFQGVPAPVACGLALFPMIYETELGDSGYLDNIDSRVLVSLNYILISFLMVSKIPTLSSKMLMRDPRRESHLKSRSYVSLISKILFLLAFVYVIIYHFWSLYFVFVVVYYMILPIGLVIYHSIPDEEQKNK